MSTEISIKQRLRRFSLTLILAFGLISVALYFALMGVRDNIDRITEKSFSQVVENSRDSRDFGRLHARLRVFEKTFYGNEPFVELEGQNLQEAFGRLRKKVTDPHLGSLLLDLEKGFAEYLAHCKWINVLLSWRHDQDEDVNELLVLIQEIIAEKIIEVALAGGEVNYLEQLVLLISGYRESLLEISKLNAGENRSQLLTGQVDDPPPLEDEFEDLILRVMTLTASEPPIDRFGRHLIDRLAYYQYLMRLYQLEMIHLGEQNRKLNLLAGDVLKALEVSDAEAASAALTAREVIRQNIYSTLTLVLSLLALLAAVFWFSHRNLFKKHIQTPMALLSSRLESFQDGDHASPMVLERSDEWSGIEKIFNRMISDLQDSLAALRDSEQRYREIFTNSTEGIYRVSLSGQILEANPAAIRILGYRSREEAIERVSNIGEQHYVESAVRKSMIAKLYRREQNLNFECRMQRKNGEQFWASISNHLVRNQRGEILYIEGTVQDISNRKEAEAALRNFQAYLQNILDSMPSVLIGVDMDGRVTLWNRRAEQESGIMANDAVGEPLGMVFKEVASEVYASSLDKALAEKKPARLLKIASLQDKKNGDKRFFDMLIYPLSRRDNSGAVIHIDEISERVRLEEMMVRSEKMQSVGSLASGLAHEINNPLAAILQNVQVLTHRLSPDLEKNRRVAEELSTTMEVIAEYCDLRGCTQMLQSIASAGQRAAKIVENMQSFSRRGDTSYASCSLTDLLERTLELASSDYDMRYHFEFHKIRIVREYKTVPNIYCEPSQIQQAILSLLKNAGQALNGQSEAPCITLRILPRERNQVCLQIEDNGPGMDEEITRQIFDPFYSTREVGSGTGLGLSIAYFIINQNHRGHLSVVSEVGTGTRFDLILPAVHSSQS